MSLVLHSRLINLFYNPHRITSFTLEIVVIRSEGKQNQNVKNLHHLPWLLFCMTYVFIFRNDEKISGINLGYKYRHFIS